MMKRPTYYVKVLGEEEERFKARTLSPALKELNRLRAKGLPAFIEGGY
jgi:hypothetical protein